MKYSQGNEERIILSYFGLRRGTLLDIGANDGKTLSNSRALMERGWNGYFVEPSPKAFAKLNTLYHNHPKATLFNIAIADVNGTLDFFESGSHLGKGDVGLVSSLKESETKRWVKDSFNPVKVEVKDFVGAGLEGIPFDFITIDAEGMDLVILKQINLQHTSCLCIEWNLDEKVRQEMKEYVGRYGMREHNKTPENLIFTK